jgi:transposase InsO family protein
MQRARRAPAMCFDDRSADRKSHAKAAGLCREEGFSSLKTERTAPKLYQTRDAAKAGVFDYIECFYGRKRRHSTIGYLSAVEFEKQMKLA